MNNIISFRITGEYASFRDPSVTSNQTVYYIPSKTAIVGILGAMIGITRDNKLGEIYSDQYLDFFSQIRIGIKLVNNPRKIIYYTNHRSLKPPVKKSSKTKPVKKEILQSPEYIIYVKASDDILTELQKVIKSKQFCFSPYLGHAYCPAKISNLRLHNAIKITDIQSMYTDCVVLDETETYNENFKISLNPKDSSGSIIIERHLHHFFEDNSFKKRVLKHWIPIESTLCEIEELQENTLSEFYKIEQKVYCLY